MKVESAGLLVNYERCIACKQCIRSCCNAHDCSEDNAGVFIQRKGPYALKNNRMRFDNLPIFTANCDLCKTLVGGERLEPACVRNCSSKCLNYIDGSEEYGFAISLRANKGERAYFFFGA